MSLLTTKPYPGLRPFETEELDIFFGRERQTDELLARLQKHRFLAVVGPSGCGKSSLVRAGMIPALESGFMTDTGASWQIALMRPGERPLLSLAEALLAPDLLGAERGEGPDSALYLKASLKRGPLSLVEVARESAVCQDANLLLLVDQFEELFRFRQQANVDEAEAFVSLLLATAAQRELPIYVVITMRSDYLGDCTVFQGLPEAINDSQYLTPRLTREECAAAITGPAQVFGGRVDPALVNRLLNDFGPDPDQLPLLQHALMRMWEQRAAVAGGSTAPSVVLTAQDYDSIGGLRHSLSRHGEEVLAGLSATQRRIAEIMFRRLVDFSSEKRDTRASARLSEVASIAGVPVNDVAAVVEVFRSRACSFITPREGPLEPDTLLDISHESLIRNWKSLSEWVKDEADAVNTYWRLRDTALLWKQGKAGLWRTPDRELALAWRSKVKPTEPWAARYGEVGDLALALEFLDASENLFNKERADAERLRKEEQIRKENDARAIRRQRLLWLMTLVTLVLAVLVLAIVLLWRRANKESNEAKRQTQIAMEQAQIAEEANQKAIKAIELTKQLTIRLITDRTIEFGRQEVLAAIAAGESDTALKRFNSILDIMREAGDKTAEAQMLIFIGYFFEKQEPEKALDYYRRAIEAAREANNQFKIALGLEVLGSLYYTLERWNDATEAYREEFEILEQLDRSKDFTNAVVSRSRNRYLNCLRRINKRAELEWAERVTRRVLAKYPLHEDRAAR
jgi:tetratricopeptide (TPR) repeat protein